MRFKILLTLVIINAILAGTLCNMVSAQSTLVSGHTATNYRYDDATLIVDRVYLPDVQHKKMKALPSRNRHYAIEPLSHIKHWRARYTVETSA